MSKHTPGPWLFETKWCDQVTSDDGCICITAEYNANGINRTKLVNRANARLIAAAPDLLEACQTFAEWLRREEEGFVAAGRSRDTPEGEKEWREWFYGNIALCDLAQYQARAAIAKATGEA